MSDDADGIAFTQLIDQIFDASGGNGIERRTGFVHQDHFRVHRNGARNTEPLLLAARETGARLVEPIFDLFPKARPTQAGIYDVIELAAIGGQPVNTRTIGHVFIDRFRKGIGFLKYHTDPRAQLHHVLTLVVDVLTFELDLPLDTRTDNRVVHAVKTAQKGRLTAARGADHGEHLLTRDVDVHALDGVLVTVIHIDVPTRKNGLGDRDGTDGLDAWRNG